MLKLYNTLSREKEKFIPLTKNKPVGLYTCGPTVYWFAHIGNLRTYIFEDILKRVLEYNGFRIKHLMNITDVGHLSSDADTGRDKIEEGARREGKSAWEIAEFYTKLFKKDLNLLNVLPPDIWIKATDTIKEQIEFIKKLEKKGFTYKISDGIYFDTSKIKDYGRLWGEKKRTIKPGARVKMVPGKKNPTDFALWKFSPKKIKRQMEWDSPWGRGFPGWHTECVVMAIKILGIPFDIHCGGVDHIPIHHSNEIAQAEAVHGKILAKYWLHGGLLSTKKGKMSKSKRNITTLNDLIKRGFNPLAFRYLCLGTHYRKKLNFSWETLRASQDALNRLYEKVAEIKTGKNGKKINSGNRNPENYKKQFLEFINNDLNIPRALALAWDLIKDKKILKKEKINLLLDFDAVFGLDLKKIEKQKIPLEIKKLVEKREKYREKNKWEKADEIRKQIEKIGWKIEDTKNGPVVKRLF